MSATDRGHAAPAWEFDHEVTRVFDDMLDRSIPEIETMRELVTDVACGFASRGTIVRDLGASRGAALATVRAKLEPGFARYEAVEVSPPMLDALRERFAGQEDVLIFDRDLRRWNPVGAASVTMLVLTLMFVPVEHRAEVLSRARAGASDRSALIVVEKTTAGVEAIEHVLAAGYYARKRAQGYEPEAIERKRLSLEGQLVPLRAEWTEDLIRAAGWREPTTFWAWGPFRAWVALA